MNPTKPSLIAVKVLVHSTVGETAILKLMCKGFPEPEVLWKHNGTVILPVNRFEMYDVGETLTLYINNATRDDSGTYQIIATNEFGTSNLYITLIVDVKAAMTPMFKCKLINSLFSNS
jgi:hypothetical protein